MAKLVDAKTSANFFKKRLDSFKNLSYLCTVE
jgi:hypothetical protein